MARPEHGIECLRKAANEVTPGDPREYYLATKLIDAVTGSFSFSGLSIGMRTTTMMVGDVAVKIPAVPLDKRNALTIHNKSLTTTIYIGDNSSVTADSVIGITSGAEIAPSSYLGFDITGDIELYAIAPSGQEAMVKITELA